MSMRMSAALSQGSPSVLWRADLQVREANPAQQSDRHAFELTRRPLRDSRMATSFPLAQPVGATTTTSDPEQRGGQDQSDEKPQVPSPSADRHGNPSPFSHQVLS